MMKYKVSCVIRLKIQPCSGQTVSIAFQDPSVFGTVWPEAGAPHRRSVKSRGGTQSCGRFAISPTTRRRGVWADAKHPPSLAISPNGAHGDAATPRLESRGHPKTARAPPIGSAPKVSDTAFERNMPARGKKPTQDWIGTLLDENTGDAAPVPPQKKRGRPQKREPTVSDGGDSR